MEHAGMRDIVDKMRSWRAGEFDGLDALIVGDLTEGAAEIERLRELVGAAANEQVEYLDRNNALEARIERLRGELAAEKGWVQQYRDSYGKYATNIAKQQDEIERLRGLLREAADAERDHYATQVSVLMKSGWYKRIREALGDE
jgi:chromosome segregation ATPase